MSLICFARKGAETSIAEKTHGLRGRPFPYSRYKQVNGPLKQSISRCRADFSPLSRQEQSAGRAQAD